MRRLLSSVPAVVRFVYTVILLAALGGTAAAQTLNASRDLVRLPVVQSASLSNANANANGAWSEGTLNAAGVAAINKTGSTQFRVYFTLDDNDNGRNDYISYTSGESSSAASRPQLIVTYR